MELRQLFKIKEKIKIIFINGNITRTLNIIYRYVSCFKSKEKTKKTGL